MYLSDKKWTLPSSVVVLKIWTFKNHHFSTISNQVNPTLKRNLDLRSNSLFLLRHCIDSYLPNRSTVPKHQSWCVGSRHPKTRGLYLLIICSKDAKRTKYCLSFVSINILLYNSTLYKFIHNYFE
jgi:hypothetical protein